MKRVNSFLLTLTLLLLLLTMTFAMLAPNLTVKAQSVAPGVSPGDSFTYGTPDGSPWVMMYPSTVPPMPQWEPFVNVSEINFNIIKNSNISAPISLITFDQTTQFRNGTTTGPTGGTFDVNTGEGSGIDFFIPAGLGAGDRIYPGNSNITWTINATMVDHTHWNGREVCVLNFTVASVMNTIYIAQHAIIYWDRLSGVLLALLEEVAELNTSTNTLAEGSLFYELIGNNVEIPMNYAIGEITIMPDGSISPSTADITTSDNVTYTFTGNNYLPIAVNRSNIVINGNGHTLASGNRGFLLTGVNNVTIESTTITSSDTAVFLNSSSGDTLSGNNITGGIGAVYSSGNLFIGNEVTANSQGIDLWYSSGNFLSGNNVTADGDCIDLLYSCDNNVLSGNKVTANAGNGIGLWYSSDCNILSGNNVTSNKVGMLPLGGGYGILLNLASSSNVLSDNNVANGRYGIAIVDSLGNNTVSGNRVTANSWGIVLLSSSGNRIFHNDFLNNTQQVSVSNSTNTWDDGYPSGGNYWSNYTGVDLKSGPGQNQTGSDGIGDNPYVIDANNTDYYPLMGIFNTYRVLVAFELHQFRDATVISNSTITGFRTILSAKNLKVASVLFNVTGKQGSTGFCRVSIPAVMMNGTLHVFVNGTEISYTLLPGSNTSISYLYFTYKHSKEQVIILPEFRSILVLPLLVITTLLGAVILTRKRNHALRRQSARSRKTLSFFFTKSNIEGARLTAKKMTVGISVRVRVFPVW